MNGCDFSWIIFVYWNGIRDGGFRVRVLKFLGFLISCNGVFHGDPWILVEGKLTWGEAGLVILLEFRYVCDVIWRGKKSGGIGGRKIGFLGFAFGTTTGEYLELILIVWGSEGYDLDNRDFIL